MVAADFFKNESVWPRLEKNEYRLTWDRVEKFVHVAKIRKIEKFLTFFKFMW
jgi:hypothetical protein